MSALEGRKRKTRVSYPSLAGAKISKGNTELTELRSGLEDYSTKKKKKKRKNFTFITSSCTYRREWTNTHKKRWPHHWHIVVERTNHSPAMIYSLYNLTSSFLLAARRLTPILGPCVNIPTLCSRISVPLSFSPFTHCGVLPSSVT